MKYIQYLWMCCIGLCLFACAETDELQTTEGKTGFVVSLKEEIVGVEARTAPRDLPYPVKKDFTIRILDAKTDEEVKSESCTGDNQLITVGVGIYDVVAEYGDASAVALDAPYYRGMAEEQWVYEDKATSVDLTCKVANSLVSIKYDETKVKFVDVYEEGYYVKVVADGTPVEIRDIAKSAYFPAGSPFEVYFCAVKKGETEEKEIKLDVERSTLNPADHLTLTLSPEPDKYEVPLSITKEEVKQKSISATIPLEWLPKPEVTATGFDANNTLTFVETEQKQAALNLNLSSALQDMKLTFNFEDEQFATLNRAEGYSLAVAEDKQAIETALGITLPSVGDREASIDLAALVDQLHTNAGVPTTNTVTVDVKANNRWSSEDETANLTYTLTCNKPEFSVAVQPENCWSREFTVDEVTVSGNADAEKIKAGLTYQYYNGTEWVDCATRENVTGRTQQFAEAAENITEKTYRVRALYRGAVASEEVEATLETPEQLPNGNMDAWNEETYEGRYSFNPWANGGTPFWDTNNDYTTRHRNNSSSVTMANYNGFHAVSYVQGRSGLAAELRSTANGRGNTRVELPSWLGGTQRSEKDINKVAGKLFTGTANVEMTGNDISGADTYSEEKNASLPSRPTTLAFYYKYAPYNSDSWSVHIELLDENRNIIVQGDKTLSELKSDWTQESVALEYAENTVYEKCMYVYVMFKSTINEGANMPYREITQTFYVMENGALASHTYSPAYVGSVLTIDDISLVYDK